VPLDAGGFFLSALGFLASRLLRFCPFAITALPSRSPRAAPDHKRSGSAPATETARLSSTAPVDRPVRKPNGSTAS
jgi:hypothetical protein